jgi:hypothetical protein
MEYAMDFLYHGSSEYYSILTPHQATDVAFDSGCQNAVYATSSYNMALAFALGTVPNENGEIERSMMPDTGDVMVFEKGTPNYGGKGYMYVLDKSKFQHTFGTQWVCFHAIEPLEIIEINVNDHLNLCRVVGKDRF